MDLASLLQEAQTLADSLDGSPQYAQAKNLVDNLDAACRASQRVCATHLTHQPSLQYSLHPDPQHLPGLPPAYFLRVCHNVRPPHVPGVVYESLVDRLAGAFLAHYFPATHQFLLQPQHTFRREAPEAALREVGEWSTTVAPSESVRADESVDTQASTAAPASPSNSLTSVASSAVTHPGKSPVLRLQTDVPPAQADISDPLDDFLFDLPAATSTPLRRRSLPPSPPPRPRVEGPFRVADVVVDTYDRLVDATPAGLRKPDLSIVFQGIPTEHNPTVVEPYPGLEPMRKMVVELPILMGESKIRSQLLAEQQLVRYADAFKRETSPAMRFLGFTLRNRGLEVAIFKFAAGGGTNLEAVHFSGGSSWVPVYEPVVHEAMCAFTAEVQSKWDQHGLCWAYEV
ncbi:hypothetical protein C8F04DRAFT_1117403 [Mycena alexandri]|uniref:Uncharacterized protein n=1 Tax=Mycena alexandri TaxID=1745969 RepID=A0AAD6SNR0_9AGAR|nr:hypothetical protein C8F04DRAFT_1117403 [Mycena alexandri]